MLHHDAWAGDPLGCYRVGQRQRGGSVRGNRGAKHTVGRLSQPSQPSLNPLASHPLVAAGGRAMNGTRFRALLMLTVATGVGSPIRGQVIRGTVVDEGSGAAVEGATVALVGPVEGVRAVTDSAGRFVVLGGGLGEYALRVERIGYRGITTPGLLLDRSDTLDVSVRIDIEAIPLAPLTITARGGPAKVDARLKRWGYYDRRAEYVTLSTGTAHFLDAEDIRKRSPSRVTDVLRTLHGVRPARSGWNTAIRTTRGCGMAVYIDGTKMRSGAIDEWVPVSSVAAIEVYPQPPYPLQYAPSPHECGTVVIWTGLTTDGRED